MQHRRGPWSAHENQHLLTLVQIHGPHNWVRISQLVGSRSPKQCRERYHQNLKPQLNHDPITPEEGQLIERLVREMGKRWAEIARRLKGRSDNAVKNWWNGGVNRRRRFNVRQRIDQRAQSNNRRQPVEPLSPYSVMSYGQTSPSLLSHRHPEDALPSPPLSSTMSRADSKEPTPSLASDSYSNPSSASPRLAGSPLSTGNQLPPLLGHHHSHSLHQHPSFPYGGYTSVRRSSLPSAGEIPHPPMREEEPKRASYETGYPSSEGYSYNYPRHTTQAASDNTHYQPQYRHENRPSHIQFSQKQTHPVTSYPEPLTPSYLQPPTSLPPTPASPNKDERMNISSILV